MLVHGFVNAGADKRTASRAVDEMLALEPLFDFGVPLDVRTLFEENEVTLIGNDSNFARVKHVFQKFVVFAILVEGAINDVLRFAYRFAETIQRDSRRHVGRDVFGGCEFDVSRNHVGKCAHVSITFPLGGIDPEFNLARKAALEVLVLQERAEVETRHER